MPTRIPWTVSLIQRQTGTKRDRQGQTGKPGNRQGQAGTDKDRKRLSLLVFKKTEIRQGQSHKRQNRDNTGTNHQRQ